MNYIARVINADYPVFRTVAPESGVTVYFRMLSLKEYDKFNILRSDDILPEWIFYEEVFKYCCQSEYSLLPDDIPAGFSISIGRLIMFLSGDCDGETLIQDIEMARVENPSNSLLEYMRTVIFTVFNSYNLEDLESWDRKKFIKIFTIAENILSKQREDFKHMDLKDLQKNASKKKQNPNGPIDFERENRAIMSNTDALEAEQILTQEQLKKLDNRR